MSASLALRSRPEELQKGTIAILALAVAVGGVSGFITLLLSGKVLAAAAAAIVGALAVGTLASAEVGVYAIITIAFVDGLLKGMSPGWHTILAKDAFLALTVARWLWEGLIGRNQLRSLSSPIAIPAFLFVLFVAVQMFNPSSLALRVAAAGFRAWVLWIPLFFVAYDTFTQPAPIRRLLLVVALLAGITAAYGIVQFNIGFGHLTALGPDFGFYQLRFGGGEHIRATSTLVSPGVFGNAAAMSAILCLGATGFVRRPLIARVLLVFVAALCIAGMATSGSRAPLIAVVAAGVAYIVLMRKPRYIILAALLGLAGVAVSELAPGALQARYSAEYMGGGAVLQRGLDPFKDALANVARKPLGTGVATGVGMGRGVGLVSEPVRVDPAAYGMIENDYGRALRELGIPGGLLFAWMLLRILTGATSATTRLREPHNRWLGAGLIGTLVAGVVLLTVGAALYLAPSGPFFFIAAGIAAASPGLEAGRVAPVAGPRVSRSAALVGRAVR